ncbi:DNA translocase FtsK 4TM domain-containing protein [Thiospirillum jenense]|uniref:DNA translocase FtsK 4TM domain-containing protein n=1 Tax=Thiospirillum jenense TaxID=1653858 RepID=A0A839HDS4_9GAMM|nr:DNA translocase FtsK 4TM domain-containing protein [Thiospirillum jenense]MBB1125327.1 DNA translocase FtsK 4TM domain-containing protein [Thiospirillum jenense]
MSQAIRAGYRTFNDHVEHTVRNTALWLLIGAAVYLLLALVSYTPNDPGWSHVGSDATIANIGGRVGAWSADIMLFLFGICAYLFPVMMIWSAILIFQSTADNKTTPLWMLLRWLGFLLGMLALTAFASRQFSTALPATLLLPNGIGGGLGLLGSDIAAQFFNHTGADLSLLGLLIAAASLLTGNSPMTLIDGIGAITIAVIRALLFLPPPRQPISTVYEQPHLLATSPSVVPMKPTVIDSSTPAIKSRTSLSPPRRRTEPTLPSTHHILHHTLIDKDATDTPMLVGQKKHVKNMHSVLRSSL